MTYSKRMLFAERLALIRRGPDECWIWTWAKTPRGYGHFRRKVNGKYVDKYSHRAAYELLVGPIAEGTELDHSCVNTSCCNPAHLTPSTKLAHVQRHQSERTHCYRGHQLIPATAKTWRRWPDGSKTCRQCYEGWNAVRWKPEEAAKWRAIGKLARRLRTD